VTALAAARYFQSVKGKLDAVGQPGGRVAAKLVADVGEIRSRGSDAVHLFDRLFEVEMRNV
jgi:hypothetical protein